MDRAFQMMEKNSMYSKQIDWKAFRADAEAYAASARQTWETYPAVAYVCAKPRNNVCRLFVPANTPEDIQSKCRSLSGASQKNIQLVGPKQTTASPFANRPFLYAMLPYKRRKYGYLVIPSVGAFADSNRRHLWAETLSSLMSRGVTDQVQGWILDLRGNSGGYLAPMLAGTQPLLGERTVLTMRRPGRETAYSIRAGQVTTRYNQLRPSVDAYIDEPVTYPKTPLPVALLHDRQTEGAAESLLIAFRGRPDTIFIGKRTAGYTQHGTYWDLSDGAKLWIAEEDVFDRNLHSYFEGVQPDIEVENPSAPTRITLDPSVLKAEAWLSGFLQNPTCN